MENKIKSLIKKLNRFGFSVKSRNNGHRDPVCEMETTSDLFRTDYKGISYYFCSDHCREQFIENPGNYIG